MAETSKAGSPMELISQGDYDAIVKAFGDTLEKYLDEGGFILLGHFFHC